MKVSGFTIIRNAQIMGYPIVESIKSLLPLVDEMIVGVGQSDDQTKAVIEGIGDPKLKLFDSIWDKSKTTGGLILSEKTNEALQRCTGDWCFYLQGDEVLHEEDYPQYKEAMTKHLRDDSVEGLLSRYIHFYGSYKVIATARNWYRNEVRVVKNKKGAFSFGDAQGFRIQSKNGTSPRKPKVRTAGGARVFHYGWVKPPEQMGEKNKHMFRWWHGNKYDSAFKNFAYLNGYGLKLFSGTHPKLMIDRVNSQDWTFVPEQGIKSVRHWSKKDFKNWSSDIFEKLLGFRIGEHKNYILLK
jgi:glycosyltransferase involved in cell wall biosynthesis